MPKEQWENVRGTGEKPSSYESGIQDHRREEEMLASTFPPGTKVRFRGKEWTVGTIFGNPEHGKQVSLTGNDGEEEIFNLREIAEAQIIK